MEDIKVEDLNIGLPSYLPQQLKFLVLYALKGTGPIRRPEHELKKIRSLKFDRRFIACALEGHLSLRQIKLIHHFLHSSDLQKLWTGLAQLPKVAQIHEEDPGHDSFATKLFDYDIAWAVLECGLKTCISYDRVRREREKLNEKLSKIETNLRQLKKSVDELKLDTSYHSGPHEDHADSAFRQCFQSILPGQRIVDAQIDKSHSVDVTVLIDSFIDNVAFYKQLRNAALVTPYDYALITRQNGKQQVIRTFIGHLKVFGYDDISRFLVTTVIPDMCSAILTVLGKKLPQLKNEANGVTEKDVRQALMAIEKAEDDFFDKYAFLSGLEIEQDEVFERDETESDC